MKKTENLDDLRKKEAALKQSLINKVMGVLKGQTHDDADHILDLCKEKVDEQKDNGVLK